MVERRAKDKVYALSRWDGACCDTTSPCVPGVPGFLLLASSSVACLGVSEGVRVLQAFHIAKCLRLGRRGGGAGILLLHLYRDTAEEPEEMHRLISHGT